MEKVFIGRIDKAGLEHEGIKNIGGLADRTDTIEADVLARLLDSGKPLTATEAARAYGRAMNLGVIINSLEWRYGWKFVYTAQEEYTSDRRRIWTIGYALPQAAIELANKLNYPAWVATVKHHRATYRKRTLLELPQLQNAAKGTC